MLLLAWLRNLIEILTSHHLSQLKPPNRIANNHNAKVIKLIIRPILDHFDLSLNIVTRENKNIKGGANTIMIPARNPRREPQPKPGTLNNPDTTKNHGDSDSQKLIFPVFIDSILLSYFVMMLS